MRRFWFAETDTKGAHYAVGSGDNEIILFFGKGEHQAQQMAMICARALNANEAEMHRLATEEDE